MTVLATLLPAAALLVRAADPWTPPPASSPDLLPFLRDTSRPKLAYSTWVGWYMDGGLNETSLFAQAEAMATTLRPHGWTHILHDYGWQVRKPSCAIIGMQPDRAVPVCIAFYIYKSSAGVLSE